MVGPFRRRWVAGVRPRGTSRTACPCSKRSASARRPTFFAGAVEEVTPALLAARWPEAACEVLAGAERTLAGRFDLLGYRDLSFGDPVDWHLDPVSGRRAPLVHWSRLDPLDAAAHRRQQGRLGAQPAPVAGGARPGLPPHRATSATRRPSRPTSRDWLPRQSRWDGGSTGRAAWRSRCASCPGAGPSSCSASSPALSPELFLGLVAVDRRPCVPRRAVPLALLLAQHAPDRRGARPVLRRNDVPGAARARAAGARRGADILVQRARPAGAARRRLLRAVDLLPALHGRDRAALPDPRPRATASPSPRPWSSACKRMLDFLLAVRSSRRRRCRRSATPTAAGCCRWPAGAPDDLRGVFSVAAAWFGRADYAWAAGGGAQPELLWMLGPAGLAAFESHPPRASRRPSLAALRRGRVRGDAGRMGRGGHHFVFDVGPLGCPRAAAATATPTCSASSARRSASLSSSTREPGRYADEAWRKLLPRHRRPQHGDRGRREPGGARRAVRLGRAARRDPAPVDLDRGLRLRGCRARRLWAALRSRAASAPRALRQAPLLGRRR